MPRTPRGTRRSDSADVPAQVSIKRTRSSRIAVVVEEEASTVALIPPKTRKTRVAKDEGASDGEGLKSKPKQNSRAKKIDPETDTKPVSVAKGRPQHPRNVSPPFTPKEADGGLSEGSSRLDEDSPPKKHTKGKRKSKDVVGEGDSPKKANGTRKRRAAASELDDDVKPMPKKKRQMKPKPPVVYVIPDVEKKETNFKGRLGYACLNTVLRAQKPDSVFCSRTCRIDTIKKNGIQFVFDLALQNVKDLYKMIEWNEANNIKFMRMSSEMFPFASHAKYGYNLAFANKELEAAGDLAKKLGHRLTMHPGQFTQLASPTEDVVTASVRELAYQCEIMDRMGLDQDGVMIIHMGGMYGDKPATLNRFRTNYTEKLNDRLKARLVLENDEMCYNLDDLMPICDELNIPIIVDYHHDWIYPSTRPLAELIPLVNETWKRKGIRVKQHLSEPRPGAVTVPERRAHADRCQSLPEALPEDMDLMIEAKDKEQAVFELYRIYDLQPVIYENLRPPKPKEEQTLATGGRKSATKKKKKSIDAEELGEGPVLEIEEKESEETAEAKTGEESPRRRLRVMR